MENNTAVHFIQCMCSTAHTYGNITAYIQNWLLNDVFPKDTFKTIHISTKLAHTQMRRINNTGEFVKKRSPMFIIKPRIDWSDDSRFLNGSAITTRKGNIYSSYAGTNLQDFFIDKKRKVAIKYQLNRSVINFDVICVFNTLIQQINMVSYLQNAIRNNVPFNLETFLESYLAKDMLKQLSEITGVPMIDENGTNETFLKYLNGHSAFPITYKLQGSTGTDEYYRYYPATIDTIIGNLSVDDDGEKIGQTDGKFQMSFSIRCEFYSTGFYFMFSDKVKDGEFIQLTDTESGLIIPIFTDVITNNEIGLPSGWHILGSPSCRLDDINEKIDLKQVINDSTLEAIKFHIKRGIPLVEFFKIEIRKQGALLQRDLDYKIDYKDMSLSFINGDTYSTYKIIIMVNAEYINELIKAKYNLE